MADDRLQELSSRIDDYFVLKKAREPKPQPVSIFELYGTHKIYEIRDIVPKACIEEGLRKCYGNVTDTTEYLGVKDNTTIHRYIRLYDIDIKLIRKEGKIRKSKFDKFKQENGLR